MDPFGRCSRANCSSTAAARSCSFAGGFQATGRPCSVVTAALVANAAQPSYGQAVAIPHPLAPWWISRAIDSRPVCGCLLAVLGAARRWLPQINRAHGPAASGPKTQDHLCAIARRGCLGLRRHPAGQFINPFLQFLKGRSRSHRDFGLQLLEQRLSDQRYLGRVRQVDDGKKAPCTILVSAVDSPRV
jgi:hypothetical protein